jgi:mevalonate kinase
MLPRPGHGFGHGKLILFGEHSVVYGQPAVAAAIDHGARARVCATETSGVRLLFDGRRVEDTGAADDARLERALRAICDVLGVDPDHLEVDVSLDLFPGAGIGSSAALSVAIARALLDANQTPMAQRDLLVERATSASEEVFHGKPSGIDQSAAMGRGLFQFQRLAGEGLRIDPIKAPSFDVVVCLAGPPASTAEMVASVASLGRRHPALTDGMHAIIGNIAREGAQALGAGDLNAAGELMNLNQGLLSALGVSTAALDEACHLARSCGAFGAKLTGAGGGGCVIALASSSTKDPIFEAWKRRGWSVFHTSIRGDDHRIDGSATP